MNEDLRWKKFPVLDKGFVCLVDVMGDDSSIVQAARVSYGEGTKHVSDDRNLIRYLMRHRHTTPFEMAELKFLVYVPMDCWRQWIRHRTANVNEYSTRYSVAIDEQQMTAPDKWRLQGSGNKQGSSGYLEDWPEAWNTELPDEKHPPQHPINTKHSNCNTPGQYLSAMEERLLEISRDTYRERLGAGVSREQARKDLPLSTYTQAYWKIDLHNLFHFLSLRMDSHAQEEIRSYANVIGHEIVAKLFPLAWEAFVDYRLDGMFLSRLEIESLKSLVDRPTHVNNEYFCALWEKFGVNPEKRSRERDECMAKMRKLGLVSGDVD